MSEPAAQIQYPYLCWALGMMGLLVLTILALIRDSLARRATMIAAVLGAPFGLFSFEFIPKYWNPNLRFWFGIASLEDLLFSGAVGGLAWVSATWPWWPCLEHRLLRRELRTPVVLRELLQRFALGAVPGIALAYSIKFGLPGQPVIVGTMWGVAFGGAVLMWRKLELWRLSVIGAAVFLFGYALLLAALIQIAPDFAQSWRTATQSHLWLGTIPLNELVWAAGYGAVWPLFVGYCLDTRWVSRTDRP